MIAYQEWKELRNIFNWAVERREKGGAFDNEWSSVLVMVWVVVRLFAWKKAGMDSTLSWSCWWWRWVWFCGFWNNIGFFGFWHRKPNRTETGRLKSDSIQFWFFFQNFSLVVFIGKNRTKQKMITPTHMHLSSTHS